MAEHHLVIPQGVQGRMSCIVAGRLVNVIVHWANPSSVTVNAALANTVFNSVKALWNTNLAASSPPGTSFVGVGLRDINTAGQAEVASDSASVVGTAPTGEALPRQIAAVLTVRTARAGKMFRGRMYWGGFAEQANGADNHMTAGFKTSIDAFAAGFLTAANVGGLSFGVAHRPTAFDEITGLPITPGLGFITPAISVTCRDNVWDTQRRRAA